MWNEERAGYREVVQGQFRGLIAGGIDAEVMERPGGIFVRRAEQIADEDRILFQSVARAVISDKRGTLAEQVAGRGFAERRLEARGAHAAAPSFRARGAPRAELPGTVAPQRELLFFNGSGGLTPD